MPLDPPALTAPLPAAPTTAAKIAGANRTRKAAHEFEAVFMTEMLRQARPPSHARGPFAPGEAEKSWSVFMDQALGEAAVAGGGTKLTREIERSLGLSSGLPAGSAKRDK